MVIHQQHAHGPLKNRLLGRMGRAGCRLSRECRLLKPDLVVMDVNMPRLDGIEATKRIREELPSTYVVGLSVNEAEHIVKSMRAAGAAAFLTKESAADHLYETIGAVTRKINVECSMDASIR